MALGKDTLLHGRYRVERPIRAGGMGEVYRAMDEVTGIIVAIKRMLPEVNERDRELFIRKFQDEVEVLEALNHPGIPRFLESFSDQACPFLVMEFIEGQDLESALEASMEKQGRPIPPEYVLRLTVQLCHILEYLHGQKPPIIHRDIKPANIIRRSDGRVFLVDFGLARSLVSDSAKTAIGTMGYSAVEQYQGRPEVRSDQYSLGVTMHELLTGKRPVPFELEPLAKLRPDLPEALRRVVDAATQLKASDRFNSILDLRKQLELALMGLTPSPEVAPTVAEAPKSDERTVDLVKKWGKGKKAKTGPLEPPKPPPEPIPEPDPELMYQVRRAGQRARSLFNPGPRDRRPHVLALLLAVLLLTAYGGSRWDSYRQEGLARQLLASPWEDRTLLEAGGMFDTRQTGVGVGGFNLGSWLHIPPRHHAGALFAQEGAHGFSCQLLAATGDSVAVIGAGPCAIMLRSGPEGCQAWLARISAGSSLDTLEALPVSDEGQAVQNGSILKVVWNPPAAVLIIDGKPRGRQNLGSASGPALAGVVHLNPSSDNRLVLAGFKTL